MGPISDDPTTVTGIARAAGAEGVRPAEVDGAASVARAAATDALAAAVATGSLDPSDAAERLIATTVAAQRPAGVTPEAWAAVEREVSALLADDPALADLLAAL